MLTIQNICNHYIKDMLVLPEKIVSDKLKKLACNFHNKRNHRRHIRISQQTLKHRLIFKKLHRVIEFKQSRWLESYIRAKAKYYFEKKSMQVFGKAIQNHRK